MISKTDGWELRDISPVARVLGQSRHTFSMQDASKEVVQLAMHSPNGRPVDSDIELWIGPDWTPAKINCHTEDGVKYPIQTLIGTRNKTANIELMNIGPEAMPIDAACSYAIEPLASERESMAEEEEGIYVEGGSVKTQPIPAEVDQVQVLLVTEGKTLDAHIELLNGPNNAKVQYKIFTNNGELNSLFVVFECPQDANAIRVRNLSTQEFPCRFYVRASVIGEEDLGPSMSTW